MSQGLEAAGICLAKRAHFHGGASKLHACTKDQQKHKEKPLQHILVFRNCDCAALLGVVNGIKDSRSVLSGQARRHLVEVSHQLYSFRPNYRYAVGVGWLPAASSGLWACALCSSSPALSRRTKSTSLFLTTIRRACCSTSLRWLFWTILIRYVQPSFASCSTRTHESGRWHGSCQYQRIERAFPNHWVRASPSSLLLFRSLILFYRTCSEDVGVNVARLEFRMSINNSIVSNVTIEFVGYPYGERCIAHLC